MDEFLYLWAFWGVLRSPVHLKLVMDVFGDLKTAWKQMNRHFLRTVLFFEP